MADSLVKAEVKALILARGLEAVKA